MGIKRLLILIVMFFLGFLLLYTWNIRTGILDKWTTNTGLKLTGTVLETADLIEDGVRSLWSRYLALIDVRDENEALKEEIKELERRISLHDAQNSELRRLRELMLIKTPKSWDKIITKVLAANFGVFSAIESLLLDKGYLDGVKVGLPLMTHRYLLGRVYQSAPDTSVALLINDVSSKVAVVSSETSLHGVLNGAGSGKLLELHFINQDTKLEIGETLYTSGLDKIFPKGVAVARVVSAQRDSSEVFQIYYAEPLAHFTNLEEIIVLTPPKQWESELVLPQ